MNEKNQLHNRNLHINGILNKGKVDIDDVKVDIRNVKVDIESAEVDSSDRKEDIENVFSEKDSNLTD